MKATAATTASLSRNHEWKQCCAHAMGFEWVDRFDTDAARRERDDGDDPSASLLHNPIEQLINLLDDAGNEIVGDEDDDDDDEFVEDFDDDIDTWGDATSASNVDAWTESALRVQADLSRMALWIRSKGQEYVGLDMRDDEASLIQSTVTSFAATTATDLETLREMISAGAGAGSTPSSSDVAGHRSGIVQILLGRLQEQVTQPFGILQRQRTRVAVQLWQNPLQCKLYQPAKRKSRSRDKRPKDLSLEDVLDDGGPGIEQRREQRREQRFMPRRPQPHDQDGDDFISKYAHKPQTTVPPAPPEFLIRLAKRRRHTSVPPPATAGAPPAQPRQQQASHLPQLHANANTSSSVTPAANYSSNDDYQEQLQDDLNAEAVQLATTLIATSDLDSVQQMETRMVEITTLIGQFSNLVQEQQEQVLQVHDSAKATKENMDKGQENLIDAAERTRRSKNYKAWVIVCMALTLLFFHIVKN